MLRCHIAKYDEIDQIADIEGCRKQYSSAKEHMKKDRFNLRKWKTPDHTFAKELDIDGNLPEGNSVSATEENNSKENIGSKPWGGKAKVLDLLWEMENDKLEFDFAKVKLLDTKTKATEKTILSTIVNFLTN